MRKVCLKRTQVGEVVVKCMKVELIKEDSLCGLK